MRFKFSAIVLCILLLGCKKGKDLFPNIVLGGHACAGLNASNSLYHDNTKEAFEYALSYPEIGAIEIDVRISKDTTAWLFHDDRLDETTNGTGCVSDQSDDYLSTLKYSGFKSEKLARAVDLPPDLKGRQLIVDLRELSGCTLLPADSVVLVKGLQEIKDHFYNTTITVLCNSTRLLSVFQSWGWKKFLYSYNYSHFSNYQSFIPFDGVCWSSSVCTEEDVQAVKSSGKEVLLFSVRSPKTIRRALKKHPNSLLVDNLKEGINEKFR